MRSDALIAACLLAASVPIGLELDRLGTPHQWADAPLAAPDRIWARLGGRKFRADALWIRLLQYCAEPAMVLERGEKIGPLAGRITALDPGFRNVYTFAGSLLMWQCDRPRDATALLERGIEACPNDRWLKYYLAAFTYARLKDLQGEIAVLERLAFAPEAPIILRRILANAYEAQGQIDRAAAIWRLVIGEGQDPGERRWAERKLARYGRSSETRGANTP